MATGLTDLAIRNAKPKEKRYTLFDQGGLYIEIAPTGGKWWRFRYKIEGKVKTLSLGVYPEVSLKEARDKRDEYRARLRNGLLPKEEPIQIYTFKELADEWLVFKLKSNLSSNTIRGLKSRLSKLESLYNLDVNKLTAKDFLDIARKLEEEGKLNTSKFLIGTARQILDYGVAIDKIPYNILNRISSILVKPKMTNRATITDPDKIGELLVNIDNYLCPNYYLVYAVRIMPYVFVRSIELTHAEWSEIDLDNSVWIIPANRMKNKKEHIVPLAIQVVKLFKEVKELNKSKNKYCFLDSKGIKPLYPIRIVQAIRDIGYSKEELTTHGFRAMASTRLNELGFRPDIIEAQLSHQESNAIRKAYNHATYIDERREMMQKWADYLDELRAKAKSLKT